MPRSYAVYESGNYSRLKSTPIKMMMKIKDQVGEGYFPEVIHGTVVFERGKEKYLPDSETMKYSYFIDIKSDRYYISDSISVDSISAKVTLFSNDERR